LWRGHDDSPRGLSTVKRRLVSNLGMYLYGAAGVALGLIGLASQDFATSWQRVGPGVAHREALAILAALCELGGGLTIFWPRSALAGAVLLTLIDSVFAALWVPQVVAMPGVFDNWGNFFEEASLVVAGLVLIAALTSRESAWARKEALIARLYGVCVVSFGMAHFVYFAGAAAWVPRWIPPGQKFWVAATGTCFLMAAAAILSGVLAWLASRLLTAMIVGFELLVWVPKLAGSPRDHFMWSGNGICVALAAAAWVIADSFHAQRSGG
jgi:hypothetical protein